MSTTGPDWGEEAPERFYVITRGHTQPVGRPELDLVTLIVARADPAPSMPPEHAAILHLCGSPLSVAEVSAYLRLPVSAVTLLLADLVAEERVEARDCVPAALLPDRALLEAVMHGLQRL
ncbi:DUF742 domain-containing protein [Kitasatospora sp. NPDC057500]|uniref:DUF742 domain-containing protein n=1 Tax=Kitasatospora sp. NPDC057500 TaxID=3346151 RepID=UPI0036C58C86